MRRKFIRRSGNMLPAVWIAAGCAFFVATQARASTPDVYCNEPKFGGLGTPSATVESIAKATATAEAWFASEEKIPANWSKSLTVLDEPGTAPSAADLAAYCSAAGESARLAGIGEPKTARAFLRSAFLYAYSAASAKLMATTAYRMSHVGSIYPPDDISGRMRSQASDANVTLDLDNLSDLASSKDPCVSFAANLNANTDAPLLSLACAARQFGSTGDWRKSALTYLELTRRLIDDAESNDLVVTNYLHAMAGNDTSSATEKAFQENFDTSNEALRRRGSVTAIEGLNAAQNIPEPETRTQLTGRLIEAALDTGRTANTNLSEFVASMRNSANGNLGMRAYSEALAGRFALASGNASEASAILGHAVFDESQRPQPSRLADWYLLASQADPAQKASLVKSAVLALEGVRPILPVRDPLTGESIFSLHMKPEFQADVDLQLARNGDDLAMITAMQSVAEASREAEIQTVFSDDCIPTPPAVKPADLKPNEIILYPIVLNDRVELFYAKGNDTRFHRVLPIPTMRIGRVRIAFLTAKLRETIIVQDGSWRAASRELYDALIMPIAGMLHPDSNLAIVPDSPILTLPFAALQDSAGKFLIQQTRLSIAPSLSYSQPGLEHSGSRAMVVAAALQEPISLPNTDFEELKNAGDEADVAAGVGTGGTPGVVLHNFSRESLRAALVGGHVDVLHLATHAAFNGGSDRSYIVATENDGKAGAPIFLSDLRKIIAENRERGDALDLLVLSACETAEGDDEANMGLAGAAIQAGARSALASLWEVNDASTLQIMKVFYQSYRAGDGKSEALQKAQLSLLNGQTFSDPYYWAAFTLIGGWR